jgi:hypothetical protein
MFNLNFKNMKTTIKAILVISAFAFFSCNKTDNAIQTDSTTTDLSSAQLKSATLAVNDVAVESVSEEANYESDFYGGYERMLRQLAHFKGKKGNLLAGMGHFHYVEGQLPAVSIDTAEAGYPITITIDYGDSTLTNHDRVIRGKVTIEISGPRDTDGSTRTINYINCEIDSIGINGTSVETFNGDGTTTSKKTTTSLVKFILPDGTVLDRTGTEVHEWLEGLATPMERDDDRIQVTGKIEVKSSTGDTYSREITVPLIRLGDCKNPVEGIVVFTKNGTEIARLDYGSGTCDNLANLTTDGATVEIELKGGCHMPKAKTEGEHEGGNHKGGMKHGKG